MVPMAKRHVHVSTLWHFVKKHPDCKHFAQSLIMLGLLSELLLFLRETWILEDLWCTSLLFMIPQGYWAGDLWYTVHSNSASNMFVSPNKICRVVEALLVPLSILMIYWYCDLAKFYMFLQVYMCHLRGTILVQYCLFQALCQWGWASGRQVGSATTCRPPAFDCPYRPKAWDRLAQYLEKIIR